jgi:uncharacterized protein with LGFP repeats
MVYGLLIADPEIMRTLILTLAAMIPLAISAQADFVTLKDGKIYEGTLIGASRTEVTLEVERAKRRFSVDEVASIHFERASAAAERPRPAAASSPIDQKYSVLAAAQLPLGSANGEEQSAPDGRGRYRLYQNGAIYYTPQTGAHAMSGPIGDMWLSLGAEQSELRYPTSEVTTLPDGLRIQHFEHGAVIWTQQDGPLVEVSAR